MTLAGWYVDALAHAVVAAQRTGLLYADPTEARRAEALHLLGAVHSLLLDPRVRPRSEEAVAVVEALRRRRAADADDRLIAEGASSARRTYT